MPKSCVRALACIGICLSATLVTLRAQAPAAPTGLSQIVAGTTVTISWNPAPGATNYIVQVGTAPGTSNLFNAAIGNTTTASGSVPNGTYFWRVAAMSPAGLTSPPSAESQFTIGGAAGPCVPPDAPQGFNASVSGLLVTLQWSPASSGGPPSSYVIEAGSASGQANLASLPTGNPATQLSVSAPPGRYFVRVRSQNACGTSGVSNEQAIDVGSAPPAPGGPSPGAPGTPGCSYALSPPSVNVPLAGGPVQVNVAASSNCRWQLQSDPFIVPAAGTSGTGSATMSYTVQGSGAPRTGSISITAIDPGPVTAPQVVVQQTGGGAGGGCAITLTPSAQTVGAAGGQFQVRVNSGAGCAWSAASQAGFVSIVSAGLQSGTDNVIYNVAANTGAAGRAGTIRVTSAAGVQDLAITQDGVGALTASFVMREAGQVVSSCQVNQGGGCSLDASASSPAAQIVSYDWNILRAGAPFTKPDSIVNPTLTLGCTQNSSNSIETFEVTLTVMNAAGQTATSTRLLSLHRAGCGT